MFPEMSPERLPSQPCDGKSRWDRPFPTPGQILLIGIDRVLGAPYTVRLSPSFFRVFGFSCGPRRDKVSCQIIPECGTTGYLRQQRK